MSLGIHYYNTADRGRHDSTRTHSYVKDATVWDSIQEGGYVKALGIEIDEEEVRKIAQILLG
jgi:hypothetical protein